MLNKTIFATIAALLLIACNEPTEEVSKYAQDTFTADDVIAAEWMYHPYHFEMYQS